MSEKDFIGRGISAPLIYFDDMWPDASIDWKIERKSVITEEDHDLIIYNLLSERYHKLRHSPKTRDEHKFKQIEVLYLDYLEKVIHNIRLNRAKDIALEMDQNLANELRKLTEG
jgi:hypothetical protein